MEQNREKRREEEASGTTLNVPTCAWRREHGPEKASEDVTAENIHNTRKERLKSRKHRESQAG